MPEQSELYMKKIIIMQKEGNADDDPMKWFNYGKFALKYEMTENAELFFQKYVDQVGLDNNLRLLMGAMNLQNGNNKKA